MWLRSGRLTPEPQRNSRAGIFFQDWDGSLQLWGRGRRGCARRQLREQGRASRRGRRWRPRGRASRPAAPAPLPPAPATVLSMIPSSSFLTPPWLENCRACVRVCAEKSMCPPLLGPPTAPMPPTPLGSRASLHPSIDSQWKKKRDSGRGALATPIVSGHWRGGNIWDKTSEPTWPEPTWDVPAHNR
jgi:hypothetical protein